MARKLESGRIEFGLQQRQTDNSWGERQLPRVRFFPTTATVGRWLASSPLTYAVPRAGAPTAPQQHYTAISVGSLHSCALRANGTIALLGSQRVRAGRRAERTIHHHHRRSRSFVWAAHQRRRHLLGRERRRADRRAERTVHHHHRRRVAFVRAAQQQHRHLLGLQRKRAGRRAERAVHRHRRRWGTYMRAAHQRHHHLLGREFINHEGLTAWSLTCSSTPALSTTSRGARGCFEAVAPETLRPTRSRARARVASRMTGSARRGRVGQPVAVSSAGPVTVGIGSSVSGSGTVYQPEPISRPS